jgi:hypothetical protein
MRIRRFLITTVVAAGVALAPTAAAAEPPLISTQVDEFVGGLGFDACDEFVFADLLGQVVLHETIFADGSQSSRVTIHATATWTASDGEVFSGQRIQTFGVHFISPQAVGGSVRSTIVAFGSEGGTVRVQVGEVHVELIDGTVVVNMFDITTVCS